MFFLLYLKYISPTYPIIHFNTIRYKKRENDIEDECYRDKFYILCTVIDTLKKIERKSNDISDLDILHGDFCKAIIDLYQSNISFQILFIRLFDFKIIEFESKLKEGTYEYYKGKTRDQMETRELKEKQEIQFFVESLYNFYIPCWKQFNSRQQNFHRFHCLLYLSLYVEIDPLYLEAMRKCSSLLKKQGSVQNIGFELMIKDYVILDEFEEIQKEILSGKTYGLRILDMNFFILEFFNFHLRTKMLNFKYFTSKLDQVFEIIIIALCVTKRSNCPIFIVSNFVEEKNHLNLQFHNTTSINTLYLSHIMNEVNIVIQLIRNFPKSANKMTAKDNFYSPQFKKARNTCYDKIKSILKTNGFIVSLEENNESVFDIPIDMRICNLLCTIPPKKKRKSKKARKIQIFKY